MTATTPTHVDSSIPELWAKLVLRDHLRSGFWGKFAGPEGSRSPVIQVTDLVGQEGDAIHIQVTNPLTGSGVAGDLTALVGSEENLTSTSKKVIPLLYRHAVRWYRRANKKSIIGLREEARGRLAEWGQEKMDDVRFANYVSSSVFNGDVYTPNFIVAGGGTTGASDVASGDKLDVQTIQIAKLTAYNNRAIPLLTSDGEEFFAMVAAPNTLYDLKRSDEYRDWVREAAVKGEGNPFFRGALAMIDGVLIFQHNNVTTANDGAASVAVSRNLLFGAEAFIEGVDEAPAWFEDDFDYGNEFGIAYSFAFQPRRGLEKNSLIVYAENTAP
jgi:N4-gp56 family major capsid protein